MVVAPVFVWVYLLGLLIEFIALFARFQGRAAQHYIVCGPVK
jgi:hypothetical protein